MYEEPLDPYRRQVMEHASYIGWRFLVATAVFMFYHFGGCDFMTWIYGRFGCYALSLAVPVMVMVQVVIYSLLYLAPFFAAAVEGQHHQEPTPTQADEFLEVSDTQLRRVLSPSDLDALKQARQRGQLDRPTLSALHDAGFNRTNPYEQWESKAHYIQEQLERMRWAQGGEWTQLGERMVPPPPAVPAPQFA